MLTLIGLLLNIGATSSNVTFLKLFDDGGGWIVVEGPAVPRSRLTAEGISGPTPTSSVRILHTSDGAHRWQDIAPAPTWPGWATVAAFQFLDAARAWVVLDRHSTANDETPRSALLVSTADGGRHWSPHPFPGNEWAKLGFVDERRGLVVACTSGNGGRERCTSPAMAESIGGRFLEEAGVIRSL